MMARFEIKLGVSKGVSFGCAPGGFTRVVPPEEPGVPGPAKKGVTLNGYPPLKKLASPTGLVKLKSG